MNINSFIQVNAFYNSPPSHPHDEFEKKKKKKKKKKMIIMIIINK